MIQRIFAVLISIVALVSVGCSGGGGSSGNKSRSSGPDEVVSTVVPQGASVQFALTREVDDRISITNCPSDLICGILWGDQKIIYFLSWPETGLGMRTITIAAEEIDCGLFVGCVTRAEGTIEVSLQIVPAVAPLMDWDFSKFNVVGEPLGLTLADLTGDGFLDILVAINVNGVGRLSVFAGNGSEAFTLHSNIELPDLTGALSTADFNLDGLLDIAVGIASPNNAMHGSVAVFLAKGSGEFGEPAYYPAPTTFPYGVSVRDADINGDGWADLVVGIGQSFGGVHVLIGRGDGMFDTAFHALDNFMLADLDVGDLDGDGALDLVLAGRNTLTSAGNLAIMLGDGSGKFTEGDRYNIKEASIHSLSLALFDSDRHLDAVLAADPAIKVNGAGDGSFSSYVSSGGGAGHLRNALGDINGDDAPDVIFVGRTEVMTVWMSQSDGSFIDVNYFLGKSGVDVSMADVDGDGRLDAVIANRESTITVALNQGNR